MKDGGPAFPCSTDSFGLVLPQGMSLRDYFACGALQLMGQARGVGGRFVNPQLIAEEVYLMADVILAEREKQ